jgi:hypothetical protein
MSAKADLLYHYTSPEGLKGIISSRKIWATDVLYLNDSAEFNYALDFLYSILEEKYSIREMDTAITFFVDSRPEERIYPSVYVVAFSSEPDQLSQWRGYCPPTGGFSIGFHKGKLEQYFKSQEAELDHCVYNIFEQRDLLESLAQEIYDSYKGYLGGGKLTLEQEAESSAKDNKTLGQVLKLAPRIKHPSFSEENEWRLVVKGSLLKKWKVQYRVSRSLLIPYVEVGPIDPDCFSQIIVGPCPHINLSYQSVKHFVRATLGRDKEVTKSEIPYRNW